VKALNTKKILKQTAVKMFAGLNRISNTNILAPILTYLIFAGHPEGTTTQYFIFFKIVIHSRPTEMQSEKVLVRF